MRKIWNMKFTLLLLVPILLLSASAPMPDAFDIRQAYTEIPLKYLPLTSIYVKGKQDNSETRDEILTYHNSAREYISLKIKDNPMKGQLQLYKSASAYYIAIEHTACKDGCENEFVILQKTTSGYTDVTLEVLKDVDLNLGNIRGTLKKQFKKSYGTDDAFKDSGYKDDETLNKHLFWQIDDQSGLIYLKESSLPHIIATYKWNEKKASFSKQ